MEYLLLIHSNPANYDAMSEAEFAALMGKHFDLIDEAKRAGVFISSNALADPAATTQVRLQNGVGVVTDGPFAEAKEVLGGYYLIDVPTLEEAQRWAAKIPDAAIGTVEIRPTVIYCRNGKVADEVHADDLSGRSELSRPD